MSRSNLTAIAAGGFIAGTLDIGAAALINRLSPFVILQVVARGVLGKASYSGGASSAALGMVLQWAMSLVIASIFVFAATRVPILRRRWIVAGLGYGVVVFFVMNYVVMPLSIIGSSPHFSAAAFALNMSAMLLFGLIIAFFAQRLGAGPADA
ncbi:MAG: hypothetical protein ACREPT_05835 [Rudaea sp.]